MLTFSLQMSHDKSAAEKLSLHMSGATQKPSKNNSEKELRAREILV